MIPIEFCFRKSTLCRVTYVAAAAFLFGLGCSQDNDLTAPRESLEIPDQGATTSEEEVQVLDSIPLVSAEVAWSAVLDAGVSRNSVVYFDVVPFQIHGEGGGFDAAWVAVTSTRKSLTGTFVDAITGELICTGITLPDGLQEHLAGLAAPQSPHAAGINQFETFPWGYDLPTPFGNHRLTCGYGCYLHTGQNQYAVDLGMTDNECVPAPASGWCMYVGDRHDGYGNQTIIMGGSAGGSSRYLYRLAHFNSIYIIPGWWIDKGRTVGAAGCTGRCTGTHVHFSVHRGSYSSGRIIGESLPLDRWPGPNDRVDYFDRNSTNQFSFNVCK